MSERSSPCKAMGRAHEDQSVECARPRGGGQQGPQRLRDGRISARGRVALEREGGAGKY